MLALIPPKKCRFFIRKNVLPQPTALISSEIKKSTCAKYRVKIMTKNAGSMETLEDMFIILRHHLYGIK